MNKRSTLFALFAFFYATTSWALPVEMNNGKVKFQDRSYSIEGIEGKDVTTQYIVRGIVHAPQCPTGSINLNVVSPSSPETRMVVMLWPKEEAVAAQFCGLKALLPMKYPLVTISGKELDKTIFSLNGKTITSSTTPTVHLIPSALKIDKDDVR